MLAFSRAEGKGSTELVDGFIPLPVWQQKGAKGLISLRWWVDSWGVYALQISKMDLSLWFGGGGEGQLH